MKGFRFSLETVRRLRASQLEAGQAELERVRNRRDAEHRSAQAAIAHAREAEATLVRTLREGAGGQAVRSAFEAMSALRETAERALGEAREADELVDSTRLRLTDAWRRSRSLDTLRDRALGRFRREERRREQKASDEAAGRRDPSRPIKLVLAGLLLLTFAQSGSAQAADTAGAISAPPPPASVGGGDLSVETLRLVLAELREREDRIERRERDLAQRERVADELSADAARLLAEIEAVRAEVEKRLAGSDAEGAARIGKLAKVYAEMPAAEAAQLLEELDPELATAILAKMKPKKSAAVLGRISKPHALRMSELVADPLRAVSSGASSAGRKR